MSKAGRLVDLANSSASLVPATASTNIFYLALSTIVAVYCSMYQIDV
jgi:hypothetical protein